MQGVHAKHVIGPFDDLFFGSGSLGHLSGDVAFNFRLIVGIREWRHDLQIAYMLLPPGTPGGRVDVVNVMIGYMYARLVYFAGSTLHGPSSSSGASPPPPPPSRVSSWLHEATSKGLFVGHLN